MTVPSHQNLDAVLAAEAFFIYLLTRLFLPALEHASSSSLPCSYKRSGIRALRTLSLGHNHSRPRRQMHHLMNRLRRRQPKAVSPATAISRMAESRLGYRSPGHSLCISIICTFLDLGYDFSKYEAGC
jgi:hypothetical protein